MVELWRVSGVLPSVISFTSLPTKLVKADNPCNKGSWTRWKASPKSPPSPSSLIDIGSFLAVNVFWLVLWPFRSTSPPQALSYKQMPGSGLFAGVVFSLLALFVPSMSSTVDSTWRVFPPVRLLPAAMSSSSSSKQSMRSSLKFWRVSIWSCELLVSCARDVWRPWRIPGRIPAKFTLGLFSCLEGPEMVSAGSAASWVKTAYLKCDLSRENVH